MTSLTTLIAKLEAATAGSRELDAEVWAALGHCIHPFEHWKKWAIEDGNDYDSGITCNLCKHETSFDPAPKLTTSLDAAMSLVPPNTYVEISGPRKYLYIPTDVPNKWRVLIGDGGPEAWAATAPLALVIACLKAKEYQP